MVSRLLRRSGVAIINVSELLDYKPDVVVQVGVGQHYEEVAVMLEMWPNLKFIGIEPHPGICDQLRDGYPGTVIEAAVGECDGRQALYSKKRHKDGSSLFRHKDEKDMETYSEIEVDVRTLDSVMSPHAGDLLNKEILLWLDCEGSELSALQGGQEFLESVDCVNVETTGNPPGVGWCDPVRLHHFLMYKGFFRQTGHTFRDTAGQVDCIYVRRDLFRPEVCSCPCQVEFYRGI